MLVNSSSSSNSNQSTAQWQTSDQEENLISSMGSQESSSLLCMLDSLSSSRGPAILVPVGYDAHKTACLSSCSTPYASHTLVVWLLQLDAFAVGVSAAKC